MIEHPEQWTLGQLIEGLQGIRSDEDPDIILEGKPIRFDFPNGGVTGDFDSYRGIYAHLAMEYHGKEWGCTVGQLLQSAKDVNGRTFSGWKGGEYTMSLDTPLWVAEHYGHYSRTAVVGMEEHDLEVVILTKYMSL